MLAQSRRRLAQSAIGRAKPHWRAHGADAAFARMLRDRKEIDRGEVLVSGEVGERVDRPARNVGGFELGQPIGGGVAAHAFGDQRIKLVDVAAAGLRVGEARVVNQVRAAGDAKELAPVPVVVGQDADMPVRGAVRPPVGGEHRE